MISILIKIFSTVTNIDTVIYRILLTLQRLHEKTGVHIGFATFYMAARHRDTSN